MKNVKFKTSAFVSILALSTAIIPLSAVAQEELFASLDANADGVISKTEAEAHSKLSEMFDDVDVNGDGYITYEEFSSAEL